MSPRSDDPLNWEDLRFFLAVARAKSLHRAAAQTGLVRSTIGRRLDSLEATLDTRLFDRNRSGLSLTEFGQALVTHAEQIEREVAAINRNLAGRKSRSEGTVRVSMPEFLAGSVVMDKLIAFTRMYPSIELSLDLSSDPANLNLHEADVAIRYAYKIDGEILGRRLVNCATCIYAAPEMAARVGSTDGQGVFWIGSNEAIGQLTSPQIADSAFPRALLKHRANGAAALLALARAGEGLVVLPCLIGDATEGLVRVPPGEPAPGRNLWLLRHPDLKGSRPVDLFVDHVANVTKTHRAAFTGEG